MHRAERFVAEHHHAGAVLVVFERDPWAGLLAEFMREVRGLRGEQMAVDVDAGGGHRVTVTHAGRGLPDSKSIS